jgi:SH3-like domain-containing protein
MRSFAKAFAAILAIHLTAPAFSVQAAPAKAELRTDTPSGLPVPRFVSLKNETTNCRMGPSFDYPITATFRRAGIPVQVVAETTDHWRKIRDQEGAECWAHQTTLRSLTHVLVIKETAILARPEAGAPPRARLAKGVLARFVRERDGWGLVRAEGLKGWAKAGALWGAD